MAGPNKLILFMIVVPVMLLVAAAVLFPLFLDKDKVLAIAATALQEKTGAILVVDGETSLSLYPGIGVSLADAAVTMPGKQQPDFRARALEIGVQLMPLFSGNVEIDSIRLDGLSARIEPAAEADGADSRKLSDQELDEFYAARRKAMAEAGEVAGAETVLAVPLALDIKSMEITDSRLELIDTAADTSTVVELIRLQATGLNLEGKPVPVQLTLRLPGAQPIAADMHSSIRIEQQTQAVTLDKFELTVTGATAQPIRLQGNGNID